MSSRILWVVARIFSTPPPLPLGPLGCTGACLSLSSAGRGEMRRVRFFRPVSRRTNFHLPKVRANFPVCIMSSCDSEETQEPNHQKPAGPAFPNPTLLASCLPVGFSGCAPLVHPRLRTDFFPRSSECSKVHGLKVRDARRDLPPSSLLPRWPRPGRAWIDQPPLLARSGQTSGSRGPCYRRGLPMTPRDLWG